MKTQAMNSMLDRLLDNRRRLIVLALYGVVALGLGAGTMYLLGQRFLRASESGAHGAAGHKEDGHETHGEKGHAGHEADEDGHSGHKGHDDHKQHSGHKQGHVRLPAQKQKSAGLKVAPVRRGSFQRREWVTGKLSINEDRTAHIHPLVEGRIHKINVKFGQQVQKDDVLAVIDSREVGDAKLKLYQNRLESRIAGANAQWAQTINENTQALIDALSKEPLPPLDQLEPKFRDKAMGENRQKLLASYADLHKARVNYERVKEVEAKKIISERRLTEAKAAYEAAQAKFHAWLEQLKFSAWLKSLHADQKLDKAESQVDVNRAKLQILGYAPGELQNIKPKAEGEAISHYVVRAPFGGTIISKDAALQERVGPDTQLFTLTDTSTLWLQADIYQKHLPMLQNLSGDTVRFRTVEYGHVHEANVFYRGEVLDPKSRTAGLTADVNNPDGHLKPGMFVEVELPGKVAREVLQVPSAAILEDKGETYVFVRKSNEEFERRAVETGQSSDGTVEVKNGLQPGEEVAVAGLFALKTAAQGDVQSTHSH